MQPTRNTVVMLSQTLNALREREQLAEEAYECWCEAARLFRIARYFAPRGSWSKALAGAGISAGLAQRLRHAEDWLLVRDTDSVWWRAKTRRRIQLELLQTLPADRTELEARERVYIEAEQLTDDTDIEHQVDHVVPLCAYGVLDGEYQRVASGLHVSWNMQAMLAADNTEKRGNIPLDLFNWHKPT